MAILVACRHTPTARLANTIKISNIIGLFPENRVQVFMPGCHAPTKNHSEGLPWCIILVNVC